MHAKGSKWLKIMGLLEVLIGCGTIGLVLWMLSQDTATIIPTTAVGKDALWRLVIIYATAAFQIVAGIVGFILSNKPNHYKVCQFFGIVLLILAMFTFMSSDFTLQSIIVDLIFTIVPAYYFYGAMLNKKSAY